MQYAPGDRVVLPATGECGVVVHAWDDNGTQDCYVAFFGARFPASGEQLEQKPYILRYYATSLAAAKP